MTTTWTQRTPIGTLKVTVGDEGISEIRLPTRRPLAGFRGGYEPPRYTSAAKSVRDALDAYFAGDLDALDALEVDLRGLTRFSRDVLEALRTVGAGEVTSYGKLAAEAGHVGAARAVGQVMARNPVPIVIPCHRVLASDHALGGYGGGLKMKRWLLVHEGAAFSG